MNPSKTFAYSVAFITAAFGIIVTAGWFGPDAVPPQMRVTIGIVLILLGIYRFAITNAKIANSDRHD